MYILNTEILFDDEILRRATLINGYDHYYISNYGRLFSTKPKYGGRGYTNTDVIRLMSTRIKIPKGRKSGYLASNVREKNYLLHRLAAFEFIPNPLNKPFVNHKDGNKLNNHIDNLEWVTASENTKHAIANNLIHVKIGEEVYNTKFKSHDIIVIRDKYKNGVRLCELSREYNVTTQCIYLIISRKNWNHVA